MQPAPCALPPVAATSAHCAQRLAAFARRCEALQLPAESAALAASRVSVDSQSRLSRAAETLGSWRRSIGGRLHGVVHGVVKVEAQQAASAPDRHSAVEDALGVLRSASDD